MSACGHSKQFEFRRGARIYDQAEGCAGNGNGSAYHDGMGSAGSEETGSGAADHQSCLSRHPRQLDAAGGVGRLDRKRAWDFHRTLEAGSGEGLQAVTAVESEATGRSGNVCGTGFGLVSRTRG